MKTIAIASIIMVILMFIFIFIMFKNIVRKINSNSKKYFLQSLQEYNSIVFDKAKELDEFQKRINECKVIQNEKLDIVRKQLEDKEKLKEIEMRKIENKNMVDGLPKLSIPEYREENFFYNYKELQKNFNVNGENILKEFIKEHKYTGSVRNYNSLVKYRNQFSKEVIYEIMSLDRKTQLEFLDSITTDTLKKIVDFEEYQNLPKFNLFDFIENIDEKIQMMDPTIYVYVGNANYNYDHIDTKIKTLFFNNMVEGLIIKYQNKMYDYSI